MSPSRQRPPRVGKRPSQLIPQQATPPASEPSTEPEPQEAPPPRPAEPPRAGHPPASPLTPEASSNPEDSARPDPDADPKAGLSDQEWLDTLPLYAQLHGLPRRIFAEDALNCRRLWAARRAVVAAFHEVLATFHEAPIAPTVREGAGMGFGPVSTRGCDQSGKPPGLGAPKARAGVADRRPHGCVAPGGNSRISMLR